MLAKFQPARVHALTKSIRGVSTHEIWNRGGSWLGRAVDVARKAPGIFHDNAVDYELRMAGQRASGSPLTNNPDPDIEMDLFKNILSRHKVHRDVRKGKRTGELDQAVDLQHMDRIMLQKMHEHHTMSEREQADHLRRSGHRYATVDDVWDHLNSRKKAMLLEVERKARGFGVKTDVRKWRVDHHILADEAGHLADLREFRHGLGGFVDSFANEFGIPLVHFNPAKLFWLDRMMTMKKPPMFSLISANTKQPMMTRHNGYLRKALLFANGDVHDLSTRGMDKIAEGMYLVSGRSGPIARLMRTMAQIPIKTFKRPTQGFWAKLRYDAAHLTGLGMQDEPIHRYTDDLGVTRGMDFANGLSDFFSKFADMINKKIPLLPKGSTTWTGMLEDAYGTKGHPADWLIMRGMTPLNKSNSFKEYAGQFTAGLLNTSKMVDGKLVLSDRITTASMFGYGFFERLNAALNSMGLGLPTRDLKSGFSILSGLIFKRVMPLAIAVESIKYMNSISSVILGDPFSKKYAEFYKDQSMAAANVRDNLGITEWAKSWAGVFPGGEFISELPVIGHLFNLNKNTEEQRKYWEEGSDPVRKGRYWDLGNTPFTGGQVEYYRPNWVRRAEADVEYSDSKYGSREEYWANSWLPTPTHPLAPIKHFFTDPYWFERKHYEDRPYPVTGGIAEIQEFPLIGGFLNNTIGQILKPQKAMHENWQQEQRQEKSLQYGRHDLDSIIPAVVDPAAAQYFPSTRTTSPILGVAAMGSGGPPSANIGYLPGQPEGDTIAYTTAGGSTEVMKVNPGTDIRDLNMLIKDKGIQRSGQVQPVRLEAADPDVADSFAPKQDPMDPLGIQATLGNVHYNVAELGGFYGFASNMMTGESFDQKPILAQSNRATSYERAFWDQDLGGLGGEANEIFRRFLPHRRRQIEEINPIRNTMPSWMPGSEYYTDFQHGDPYIKVKNGEERLPGEGYEKLWNLSNPATLSIGASYIGKSQEDIVGHLLKRDELDKDEAQDIMGYGERVHKKMQAKLTQQGVMIDYEQHVQDLVHAVNGFYDGRVKNDKFVEWAQQNAGMFTGTSDGDSQAIIEMKTMSDKAFHSGEIKDYHRAQLNFYQGKTGLNQGYLIYLNRDNPDEAAHVYGFGYDEGLYKKSLDNVKSARNTIRRLENNGVIGPADTYDQVDRLRVLADVAPYSDQYRNLRDQIGKMDLGDDDKKRVQEIRHQVAQKKKFTRMTPYKFKTAEVSEETVTVTKVMPGRNYMFLTEEYATNPLRLAGINIPSAKDDPIAEEAHAVIASYIQPGMKLKVLVNRDPLTKVNNDTYQTISAVIESGPIKNLNHELLSRGLAQEKESDDSATGVYARYNPLQRTVGRVWENIAHLDNIINTKWLQVRSPLESYERREVYGKDWQDWNHPIRDFLMPAFYKMAHQGVLVGAGGGAVLGLFMGRTRFAKLIGVSLGILAGGTMGAYGNIKEAISGKEWIPEVRQKEWDTNEYLDTLNYVKDQKLFQKYAKLAKDKEGFDVARYLEMNKRMGKKRKAQTDELEKLKRELKFAQNEGKAHGIRRRIRVLTNYQGENGPDDKDLLKALNQKIYELANTRDIKKLGEYSAKAISYYQDSEKTLYGYRSGGPLENLLAALPKKDREYLLPFMEAPMQERHKILEETPVYMRRALEANWGLPVEEKDDLPTYFSKHELPDANWVGWDERVSMDDVKVKIIKREAMDQSEFDIWNDDVKRADRVHIDTPEVYHPQLISQVRRKLEDILGKNGLSSVDVQIEKTKHGKIDVEVNVEKDRRREVTAQLNQNGLQMFT